MVFKKTLVLLPFLLLFIFACSRKENVNFNQFNAAEKSVVEHTKSLVETTKRQVEKQEKVSVPKIVNNSFQSMKDFLAFNAPDVQKFRFDPSEDIVLEGKQGTKIFIPANSLEFADGTQPKGKVRLGIEKNVTRWQSSFRKNFQLRQVKIYWRQVP